MYAATLGRFVPRYAFVSLLFCLLLDLAVYSLTKPFVERLSGYDLSTPLDGMIPFSPWWIIVYFGCFAFWAVNFVMITRTDKEHWYRFYTAVCFALIVCGVFFVVMPVTITRPEITEDGLIYDLVRFLYKIDTPTNLFPSIHCLASWYCWVGIRGRKEIALWYRIFSFVVAVAVFCSTVFLKQHFIVDGIAGIFLAEGTVLISRLLPLYKYPMHFFDKLDSFMFE